MLNYKKQALKMLYAVDKWHVNNPVINVFIIDEIYDFYSYDYELYDF